MSGPPPPGTGAPDGLSQSQMYDDEEAAIQAALRASLVTQQVGWVGGCRLPPTGTESQPCYTTGRMGGWMQAASHWH